MILPSLLGSAFSTPQWSCQKCEGCFCNDAMWRAEGDHDMDFDIEKGVAESKTQPRAQSLAQGLVGHLPKIIESQDHGNPSKMRIRTKKSYQGDIADKKSKEQLLGRASYCSLAGSGLKQNNLNQND